MKRLTGGLDEDGNPYFDLRKGTRRGAEAIIRTSVQAVANDARMRVYKDNADIIEGLQWVSTLDMRTTIECAALDGLMWDINGNPIGHGMMLDPPPRHWNCRSVLAPVTKSFREMGIPIDEFPESTRASMDGQVPESQTFEKWIAGKPDKYADEVFGKGRAELWRQGKISVRDMVDQRGNPLTLEELRKQSSGPVAAPFVPAKSIKEAEEWAMAQGLVRHADYKGIDLEVANEWNRGIYENTRDIPGLKGELLSTGSAQQHYLRLYEMEVDSMFNFLQNHATRWAGKSVEEIRREAARLVTKRRVGKEWAFSTLDDRAKGIFINSKYGSTKGLPELKKELSHSVSSGFSPVGCDTLKSLVDHEMGHQIDAFLGVGNDSRVKELFSSLGKKDVIGVELSRYGKTNIAEFIAEGWAEYRNNPSPRPVAKQIGEIIMELASRRGVVK